MEIMLYSNIFYTFLPTRMAYVQEFHFKALPAKDKLIYINSRALEIKMEEKLGRYLLLTLN